MDSDSLEDAKERLRQREGTTMKNIGNWLRKQGPPKEIPNLGKWAVGRNIDSVIWTALPPKFNRQEGRQPSMEEVLMHLRALSGTALDKAEEYIRRAPRQIDTAYRRRIEADLQWLPRAEEK